MTNNHLASSASGPARLLKRLGRSDVDLFDLKQGTPLPWRPTSRDDVPAAAWAQLEKSCDSLELERLLLIPGTGKRTWIGGRLAMRTRVLAFGTTGVGEWTENDGVGAVEFMPVDDLLAIDDRVILLRGRLALIGRTRRLETHYNTVARALFLENVLRLRQMIAGPRLATERNFVWLGMDVEPRPASELPYKWANLLLERTDLRIDSPEAEMVAVGDVVELGARRKGPATGLALLGPRELVIAAEPPNRADDPRHGVDLTVVPRRHIRDVGWSRGSLTIRLVADGASGPSISRPLDERLFEAMRQSFGDAVAWA